MGVPTAVHFRNLERTSEKTGMTYFPSFLFFYNNLQKTAVCYCYQQAVQWQRPLNSLGTSIQKRSEKAG